METTTTGTIGRVLETACWSFGVLLLVLYFGARAYGEVERRQAISTFAQARAVAQAVDDDSSAATEEAFPSSFAAPGPDQTAWSPSRIRAYAEHVPGPSLPASALLRIHRIGLEVPIYLDVSERNLNRGAGLIAGTGSLTGDGNIGIAAHRDGYFRALEDVVVGDIVALETLAGERRYRVTDLSIVEPTDMSPLDETAAPAVTLVTCYPFYFAGAAPQRYIVRADAVQ